MPTYLKTSFPQTSTALFPNLSDLCMCLSLHWLRWDLLGHFQFCRPDVQNGSPKSLSVTEKDRALRIWTLDARGHLRRLCASLWGQGGMRKRPFISPPWRCRHLDTDTHWDSKAQLPRSGRRLHNTGRWWNTNSIQALRETPKQRFRTALWCVRKRSYRLLIWFIWGFIQQIWTCVGCSCG